MINRRRFVVPLISVERRYRGEKKARGTNVFCEGVIVKRDSRWIVFLILAATLHRSRNCFQSSVL